MGKRRRSPLLCAHANECPQVCPCDDRCACRGRGRMCEPVVVGRKTVRLPKWLDAVAREADPVTEERQRIAKAQAAQLKQLADVAGHLLASHLRGAGVEILGIVRALRSATRAPRRGTR